MVKQPRLLQKRLVAGVVVFIIGQLAPLAIPLVLISSLPTGWKTAIPGFLLLGAPEFAIRLSAVILGKSGIDAIKSKLFRALKLCVLPDRITCRRYYVGLVIFLTPLFFGWLSPYLYQAIPRLVQYRLMLGISGDVTLIASLVVLGSPFWGKLQALTDYDAEVTLRPRGRKSSCNNSE